MEIDVTRTDIAVLSVRDFFFSDKQPIIRYTPSATNAKKVTVEIDDWVFPKGGVDFVWVIESERRPPGVNP